MVTVLVPVDVILVDALSPHPSGYGSIGGVSAGANSMLSLANISCSVSDKTLGSKTAASDSRHSGGITGCLVVSFLLPNCLATSVPKKIILCLLANSED